MASSDHECCSHPPGPGCWAHSCCNCCSCPLDVLRWRIYHALGGRLSREEFLALPEEEQAGAVGFLNMLLVMQGTAGITFGEDPGPA